MCGIAGIYRLRNAGPIPRDALVRMIAAQRHRGPEEWGLYRDDRIGLGHARLSIIDLQGGAQPIGNEDETLWIIANGEIFNYVELRAALIARGHRFRTASDTEVLLHAYEDDGPDCLQRINGEFALAVWDARTQRLFLARDRFGIRPLHYARSAGALWFASEIKGLLAGGALPRAIDPLALEQVFTFWATLPGRSAFRGIEELPPGHCLTAAGDEVRLERYWEPTFCAPEGPLQEPADAIAARVRELLADAVRIRLRADVPVGCYLSGGLDSSAVTALVAREFNADVRTFGIRFDDPAFDEGSYQQAVVAFLNVAHTELRASADRIAGLFPETVWHCEKPLLRLAPVPLFALSREVHERGYKVVLTGEGADEVFGGYELFLEAKVRAFLARQPGSARRARLLERLYPDIFRDARSRRALPEFFARGLESVADPLFSHRIRWENTRRIRAFFSADVRAAIGSYEPLEDLRARLPAAFPQWDTLSKAQYLETILLLGGYLLCSQGDRVAMAHAVECRLPYLDHRLIEYLARVPPRLKIAGLDVKHVLKKAVRDAVPDSVLRRPKHPYRAPIADPLLQSAGGGYVRDVLSAPALEAAGLFDAGRVERFLTRLREAGRCSEVEGMALVGLVSTQLLHEQFVARAPAAVSGLPAPAVCVERTAAEGSG